VSSASQLYVSVNLLLAAWFLECINQWFDLVNALTKLQALHPISVAKIAAIKTMRPRMQTIHGNQFKQVSYYLMCMLILLTSGVNSFC